MKKKGNGSDHAYNALSDQIFGARTITEIEQAEAALRMWLLDHPDRQGRDDGFEVLSHKRDFAEWTAANPEEAKVVEAHRRVRSLIDDVHSLADIPAAQEALRRFLCDYPDEDVSSDTRFLSLLEEAHTVVAHDGYADAERVKAPAQV